MTPDKKLQATIVKIEASIEEDLMKIIKKHLPLFQTYCKEIRKHAQLNKPEQFHLMQYAGASPEAMANRHMLQALINCGIRNVPGDKFTKLGVLDLEKQRLGSSLYLNPRMNLSLTKIVGDKKK